jgi:type I restriction enzyme S subunit
MESFVKLTDVCDFQGGTQPPKSVWKKDLEDGYIRMLQIRDFTQREKNNVEYIPYKKTLKTCEEQDILIGRYGASVGKICTGLSGAYNVALVKTKPNLDKIRRDFLLHLLRGTIFQNFILNVGDRAAQAGFNKGDLEGFEFSLPPLDHQKKIAAILDAADAYRQKTKTLITKYEELTQSLFLEMFGDPVRNPMGWKIESFSNLCLKITDGTHHSPEPQEEGFPYVTAKHVKPFRLKFDEKATYVNEVAHNEIYKRCAPEYGDVFYIKDGATTGIACINTFNEPVSMLSSLALLKLGSDLNNQFLCHWLNHEGIKQKLISEFMSGAAIQRYTLTKIKSFKIMVPKIELQNQFADSVKEIEAQKTQAQASLVQAEDLFNSLLQRAFKGELS